jgi:hypothetical protein
MRLAAAQRGMYMIFDFARCRDRTPPSVGDLWSFPFDLETGTPTRPPVQLTHGPLTVRESPSISADGQRVAFNQFESSKMSVWVHDLASGKEASWFRPPSRSAFPLSLLLATVSHIQATRMTSEPYMSPLRAVFPKGFVMGACGRRIGPVTGRNF